MYSTELLTGRQVTARILLIVSVALLSGCANRVHTLDSTSNMTRNELFALCEDLQMRADLDCRWNVEERQSSVTDQQTWEINCRARRDSARESFDNVCQASRFRAPEVVRKDEPLLPQ